VLYVTNIIVSEDQSSTQYRVAAGCLDKQRCSSVITEKIILALF